MCQFSFPVKLAAYADIFTTGFVGSGDLLSEVGAFTRNLKRIKCAVPLLEEIRKLVPRMKGSCLWVMDPVMGDQGRQYVSCEVPSTYRREVCFADVILPNEFELRWLLEKESPFSTEDEVLSSVAAAHVLGPSCVFLTSAIVGNSEQLLAVLSVKQEDGTCVVHTCRIFNRQAYVGGCGDCLTALFVDRLLNAARKKESNSPWGEIMRDVLTTLQVK